VEPTRLQKERKAKEQLAEKHINRSWEKELEGVEIYCQTGESGRNSQTTYVPDGTMDSIYIYICYGQ
jgi:hypothetical protein